MPAPKWMTPWRWGQLEKAKRRDDLLENKQEDKPRREPMSWSFDPRSLAWVYSGEAPSEAHPGTLGIDYGTLMTVARIPVIGSILQTRIQQVGEFAQPQSSPYSVGFKIKLRDTRKEATKAQHARAYDLEQLIMHAGGKYNVGGFDSFLRMITRDRLTYDQANAEIIPTKGPAMG